MFDNLHEGNVYLRRVDNIYVKPIIIEESEEHHREGLNLCKDVDGEFIRFKTEEQARKFITGITWVVAHYADEFLIFKNKS